MIIKPDPIAISADKLSPILIGKREFYIYVLPGRRLDKCQQANLKRYGSQMGFKLSITFIICETIAVKAKSRRLCY